MAELKKMSFKDSYRLERVYYENMWTLLNLLKGLKDNPNATEIEKINELIENAIADNESIIIIYKNLGELYAEDQNNFTEIGKELKELRDNLESWKDEINDKIDDVNNTIMSYIREIWERLDAIEADLAQMGRLITYEIGTENDEYTLSEKGVAVTFEQTAEYFNHERPHLVVIRGELNSENVYLFPREYDTSSSGLIEWYGFEFNGNEIREITITLHPDDSVSYAVKTTDFASILSRIGGLETRVTTAEGDIDNLELNKQDKLTAGQNITIDANNVISATGGSNIVAGVGIGVSQVSQGTQVRNLHEYRGAYKMSIGQNPENIFLSHNYFNEVRLYKDPELDPAYNWDEEGIILNTDITETAIETLPLVLGSYVNSNFYLRKTPGSYNYVNIGYDPDSNEHLPFAFRLKTGVNAGTIPDYSASKEIMLTIKLFAKYVMSFEDNNQTTRSREICDNFIETTFHISTAGVVTCPELLTGYADQKQEMNSDVWIDSLLFHFNEFVRLYYSESTPYVSVSLGCKISFNNTAGDILSINNDTDLQNNIARILNNIKCGNYMLEYVYS